MRPLAALTTLLLCFFNTQILSNIHHHKHHSIHNDASLLFGSFESSVLLHVDHVNQSALELLLSPLETKSFNDIFVVLRVSANQSIEAMNKEIDSFITPRPWWSVEAQPYSWCSFKRDFVLQFISSYNDMKTYQEFVAHQFQTEKACSSLPLYISVHDADAWANRILNVQIEWRNKMWALFYVFTSADGAERAVAFAEQNFCQGLANKWECMFLPMSNCTLPRQLTSCKYRECLPRPWEGQFFSNASQDGTMISEIEEPEFIERHAHLRTKIKYLGENKCVEINSMFSRFPTTVTSNTTVLKSSCLTNRVMTLFTFGIYLRFNYMMRSRIAQRMFEFRAKQSPPFGPSLPCVAAHIRMGDRNIANTDMVEWCRNCSVVNANGGKDFDEACTHIDETTWFDMGCDASLPFGASSLQHYINASLIMMPHNTNLYIMTDDPEWLRPQIDAYTNGTQAQAQAQAQAHGQGHGHAHGHGHGHALKLFVFGASPDHRSSSSDATVEFWASIKLAQQCQAFVGHFSSASTLIIFRAMCFRHANETLRCPPAYDIGGSNL